LQTLRVLTTHQGPTVPTVGGEQVFYPQRRQRHAIGVGSPEHLRGLRHRIDQRRLAT
jgi:hypothetical protein